jgi:glutamine cyclotransferase
MCCTAQFTCTVAAFQSAAGIAWDHHRQRLFITGKYWPRIFEVVPVLVNATDDVLAKRQTCFVR